MGRDGQDNSSGNRGMMGQPGSGGGNYSSDGERIFLSGIGSDGEDIARSTSNGSGGSPMMGGGGCGSCHGNDGRGATIRVPGGTTIETPDITYDELIEDGFTDATIAVAIRDGVDEKGEQMDAAMPRWQMSQADVDATIAYLKVLSAQ
jgi:mono/diheme cytochrome c family protein